MEVAAVVAIMIGFALIAVVLCRLITAVKTRFIMSNSMTIWQLSKAAPNEPIHIQAYHENVDGKCYLLTNTLRGYEGIMSQPVMNWYIAGDKILVAVVDLPEKMMKVLEDI